MALTKSDKIFIESALDRALGLQESKFSKNLSLQDSKFENKLDKLELKFETKVTEFKDEFYTRIDPILKEIVDSREDREIGAEQHLRNQDRIDKLEKIHPQGNHLATI